MTNIIDISQLHKNYGNDTILNNIDLSVPRGEVIGLIGPNGAGKTTLLKTILGLSPYSGDIHVLGMNPQSQRAKIMERVSFVADTAILPSWLKVKDAIQFMSAVHPAFNAELAERYINDANIRLHKAIRHLSKGMIAKVHLSLIMAIDSELLVLDEPTLGLDIVNRKSFYQQLLSDYFDKDKTIIITTHQVEEIENLLTRVIFINNGNIILDEKIDEIDKRFFEVKSDGHNNDALLNHKPIHISQSIAGQHFIFDKQHNPNVDGIAGSSRVALADLFVAMISQKPCDPTAQNPQQGEEA